MFKERHYGVHLAGAYPDFMDTGCVFSNFACSTQMLDEDNSRELSHQGGGKRGQRIYVGVATFGDV